MKNALARADISTTSTLQTSSVRIRALAVTWRRIALVELILMAAFAAMGAPDSGAVLQTGIGESYHVVAPSASVPASREALTTKRSSPVAHDK
jgi:hypothetical protein